MREKSEYYILEDLLWISKKILFLFIIFVIVMEMEKKKNSTFGK